MIFVPAQKEDGVYHVHGFLRVPAAALALARSLMTVQTKGAAVVVDAPLAVQRFAQQLTRSCGRFPYSLHIDHESEAKPSLVDVAVNRSRRAEKLDYLIEPGPEVRSWDAMAWVPGRLWRRLDKRWAADASATREGDEVVL